MKTIGINPKTKEKLTEFADGLSINKAMRKLLESAEPSETYSQKPSYVNIGIDDDLFDKLKKCKKYSSESHSVTIERLLDEFNTD